MEGAQSGDAGPKPDHLGCCTMVEAPGIVLIAQSSGKIRLSAMTQNVFASVISEMNRRCERVFAGSGLQRGTHDCPYWSSVRQTRAIAQDSPCALKLRSYVKALAFAESFLGDPT
jgi:hypothetical protein